jgi:primosomal protein N' (replication factor Y)
MHVDKGFLVKIFLRSRRVLGIVESLLSSDPGFATTPIAGVVHPFAVLSEELLSLAKWMVTYYGSTYRSTFELLIPRFVRSPQGCHATRPFGKVSSVLKTCTPIFPTTPRGIVYGSIAVDLRAERGSTHVLCELSDVDRNEVSFRSIELVLSAGTGTVLILVPEIDTSLPSLATIRRRFETYEPIVWHSRLRDGERRANWWSTFNRESQLVIGTRSAAFLPLRDLKLIVVYDEYDPIYKNPGNPRYNGRDVALCRARIGGVTCILESAVPSLESWANGSHKRHLLPHLDAKYRADKVHVVDLRYEKPFCGTRLLSLLLRQKIFDNWENGGQTLLLLNRRGHATQLQCRECGCLIRCPDCRATVVEHRPEGVVRCHLCGWMGPTPIRCPKCRHSSLSRRGTGTQRVEVILQKVFPKMRILRVDSDTAERHSPHTWMDVVRRHRVDIVVGTRATAGILHWPILRLVGILNADADLAINDFRTEERTFQDLMRVVEHTRWGGKEATVVVQTFGANKDLLDRIKNADAEGFLTQQLAIRRDYSYPPYAHIVRHIFRGRSDTKVWVCMERWKQFVLEHTTPGISIRGPIWAPRLKVNGVYRGSLFFFVDHPETCMPVLTQLFATIKLPGDVADTWDVDPIDFS